MGKVSLPQRRRRAREIALQLIYELDLRPDLTADEAIEMYPWDGELPDVTLYSKDLVSGVYEHACDIDEILREHIVGWRTERMVAVDRASIRLALFEGLIGRKVPIAVAISEAVELTKMFGTLESGGFVNGVLGRIVRSSYGESLETECPAAVSDKDM
ncbi:MAG: transcription antitermination factor NusB [Synergistaceae bacterium]|nr:transcription antitermination factor NusB [Synergistaceae bacterium]